MIRFLSLIILCLYISAVSVSADGANGEKSFTLTKSSSSYLISNKYPITDLKLDFLINYKKSGTIFDTVGINAAPIGSWSRLISDNGVVSFCIYDPKTKSEKQVSNGWHVLTAALKIPKLNTQRVILEIHNGLISLKVGNIPANTLKLTTQLSGEPVYAGDFPGDDSWGDKYNIHPAMVGTIVVKSFSTLNTEKVTTPDKPVETDTGSNPPENNGKDPGILKSVPTDTPEAVDAGVKIIEDALRNKDVEKATSLITADSSLRDMFVAHKDELPRVADILATRKLVVVSGSYAEYELTQGERTFTAIFYKINGKWQLSSL